MREPTINLSFNSSDMLNLETGAGSDQGQGFAGGYAEKLLSYRHPPSVNVSAIRPLSVTKNVTRTMTIPSQQSFAKPARLSMSDGYAPSIPRFKYVHQTTPAQSATFPERPMEDSSIAYGEELLRYPMDTIPQLTHSGNHNGLELALAPVGRAPETRTVAQANIPEPHTEKGGEGKAAPDIRALAREIYPLIKRMIMIERDRHPTWY
jgi:hypothetical protein